MNTQVAAFLDLVISMGLINKEIRNDATALASFEMLMLLPPMPQEVRKDCGSAALLRDLYEVYNAHGKEGVELFVALATACAGA